jgi:hypothetical protein
MFFMMWITSKYTYVSQKLIRKVADNGYIYQKKVLVSVILIC